MGKFVNYRNVSSYLDVCTGRKETDNKSTNQSNLSVPGKLPELELFPKSKAALVTFAIMLLLHIFFCAQKNYCIFTKDFF